MYFEFYMVKVEHNFQTSISLRKIVFKMNFLHILVAYVVLRLRFNNIWLKHVAGWALVMEQYKGSSENIWIVWVVDACDTAIPAIPIHISIRNEFWYRFWYRKTKMVSRYQKVRDTSDTKSIRNDLIFMVKITSLRTGGSGGFCLLVLSFFKISLVLFYCYRTAEQ